MPVKVALRLSGLDMRDVAALERIPAELAELSFRAKGPVSYVLLHLDRPAAHEVAEWARKINKLIPGARVTGVYEELLGMAEIASRCGVAPEAVRLWAAGKRRASVKPFPQAREVIKQGASGKLAPLFAWSEVLAWVREVLHVDPEDGVAYLSAVQVADLNSELAHLDDGPDEHDTWNPLDYLDFHERSAARQVAVSQCTVVVSSSNVVPMTERTVVRNQPRRSDYTLAAQ